MISVLMRSTLCESLALFGVLAVNLVTRSLNGAFCPTILPLFQGARRSLRLVALANQRGRSCSGAIPGEICQVQYPGLPHTPDMTGSR